MTFEAGKTYETRDGREALIVHAYLDGDFLVTCEKLHWLVRSNGEAPVSPTCDLIAPKPEPRRVWLDVYSLETDVVPMRRPFTIDADGVLREMGSIK